MPEGPRYCETIILNGIRCISLSEINPTPTMKRKKKIFTTTTRGSLEKPSGRRISADYGSDISFSDVEFEIPYLTPEQDAELQEHFDGTEKGEYSPDDGVTNYLFRWASDGYDPSNYENNGALFSKAKCKLMIVRQVV